MQKSAWETVILVGALLSGLVMYAVISGCGGQYDETANWPKIQTAPVLYVPLSYHKPSGFTRLRGDMLTIAESTEAARDPGEPAPPSIQVCINRLILPAEWKNPVEIRVFVQNPRADATTDKSSPNYVDTIELPPGPGEHTKFVDATRAYRNLLANGKIEQEEILKVTLVPIIVGAPPGEPARFRGVYLTTKSFKK